MDSDEDMPIAQLLQKRKANGTPSKPGALVASPAANNKKRRIVESEDDTTPAKEPVVVMKKTAVKLETAVKVEKTISAPKIKSEQNTSKPAFVIPKPVSAAEAVVDDEDDDDIPISQLLMQRKSLQMKTFNVPKPVKAADVTASDFTTAPKKTRAAAAITRAVPARTSSQANRVASRIQDFYSGTDKGFLLQTLLVRWWYAIEWPDRNAIGNAPAGYEELDGFPGVFVSTRVESLGKILDRRDKSTCPSFANLYLKPSEYIKDKCITALERQMDVLREVEGDEAPLLIDLQQTLKKVKKISASAADNQAKKFGLVL